MNDNPMLPHPNQAEIAEVGMTEFDTAKPDTPGTPDAGANEAGFAEPGTRLLEPSFADLVAAIEQASDLSEQKRRHWLCSVRQVANWLDRPAAVIPARWIAVRALVVQLHHARVGVTAKTLSNHKSNLRAALRWHANEHDVPQRGTRLTPEWVHFRERQDSGSFGRLSNFIRYCSARGIAPSAVENKLFEQYWRYRAANTAYATHATAWRFMVREWNSCAEEFSDLSLRRLTEPQLKLTEPAWEKFPERLRNEIEDYLATLAKPHRNRRGQRIAPCKKVTINYRRAELVAMARMAVRIGVPIDSLMSLGALLHPDVAERVIEAYWQRAGEEPTTSTIDLGWKMLRMARETGCLDQPALDRLEEIRATLEEHRRGGLTEKNLKLIRQVLTEGVWNDVVALPAALMQQARLAKDHAPIKAAIAAQLAVAIGILTFAPVRLRNLISIELGQNLVKPSGPETPYWLVFPFYDVKNKVDLNFRFDEELTDLIDEYVHEFRPTLLRGVNSNWLFPGEAGAAKWGIMLSKQITTRIQKAVGFRITVHQFRHAAAAIYLKHHPGITRLSGGCSDIETSTPRLSSTAVWNRFRQPRSSVGSFGSRSTLASSTAGEN